MRRHYILLVCLLAYMIPGAHGQTTSTEFIENKGQWGTWVKYMAKTLAGELYLEQDGFRYVLSDDKNTAKLDSFHHGLMRTPPTIKHHVYKVSLLGANNVQIIGKKQQAMYYNYFLGNDPKKWASGIHPYLALEYPNVYDGIDMHVGSEAGSIVYDFYVAPEADVTKIKLKYEGPDRMRVDKQGNLNIYTSVGEVRELTPYVYQYIGDEKVMVACNYKLEGNVLSFEFPDGYDKSRKLIIDPTVTLWASFTGSTADNWGFTATYDDAGNFYMGGIVNCLAAAGGGAFPVSPGAYQTVWGGGQGASGFQFASDIGIMKLSPDGTTRIYATYIGGVNNERPHSMIVDPSGNLIIAGRTLSPNYPVTPGAVQTVKNSASDIIVTKLNAAGSALVASTFLGGSGEDGINFDSTEYGYGHLKFNYGDDARSEVQVDNLGNIYVAGCTSSPDFPTTSTAIATTLSGLQDGVVFKLNSNMTTLLWSTYLSGIGDEAGYVLAFNPSQTSVYVAGGTSSPNFPVGTGGWQSTYQGDSADGFILKFRNSAPYNVQRGTYVGTSNFDQVYGIQVDYTGNVYVMGQSMGGTFPITPGVYSNPNNCQFIMKIDSNLSTNLLSTQFGSIPGSPTQTNISPVAFLVDTCENIYVSGWGGNIMGLAALSHTGTTTNMPVTSDAFQSTTDGFDFYFIVLSPGMSSLLYATYYGRNATGSYGEHVDGGTSRFDKKGIVYQGICANCGGNPTGVPSFPTTPGVYSPTMPSPNCNQAGLKIAFNIGPVDVNINAGPSLSGCAPLTVNFTNATTNALSYVWNFGDGSAPVTSFAPSHTFTAAGTFTVTLAAANSSACFKTDDTAYLVIHVDTNKITPNFSYSVLDSCNPYIVSFTNTSTTTVSPGTPTYTWLLGDGNTYSGTTPPNHNYPDTGRYTVTLIMAQTGACKTPDTIQKEIRIYSSRVGASFDIPDSLCLGQAFTPTGGATNASGVRWIFSDTSSSSATNPTYLYGAPGTYTVTLVASNEGTCNGADTATHVITILPAPTAAFNFTPVRAEANKPTTFKNLSLNATRYNWDFGDGSQSEEVDPVHQFTRTGEYNVCLTAYNNSNCPSKVCKKVPAEVVPQLGIPTGFSPNGDGQNDILYVRGAAIKTMDLKIYNRWGQLIFQTNTQEVGWDGTYNGQPQPMEAYGYVLTATFIDGTNRTLKGNITLLR